MTAYFSSEPTAHMIIVLVGPSGCGKTVVGKALANSINATFLDADDFHTAEAKELMHSGHALTDDERHPWLERIRQTTNQASLRAVVVLACSALKPELRSDLKQQATNWKFVALEVDTPTLRKRLSDRTGHFFPASLLDTQLVDWHPLEPGEGFSVDGTKPVDEITAEIRRRLGLTEQPRSSSYWG